MNDHRRWIVWVAVAAALAANVASAATQANAGLQLDRSPGTHQAHDFSDGFYRQNGLDPKSADFRRRFEDVKGKPFLPFSKKTNTKDPTRSKTRVLPVNCGYDASGQRYAMGISTLYLALFFVARHFRSRAQAD